MNAHATPLRSRVIVAVGPTASDPLALAAAARLARASGAELAALFVEDINLLRLAELPFAYEISATSGTSRRFAASDVERAFKSQADELRRTLVEVAGSLQLDLTFEIARGRPISVLLEARRHQDIVVLANAAVRTLARASAPNIMRDALRIPKPAVPPRKPHRITAVLQSTASAPRILAAAQRLAGATDAELVLLLAGQGETSTDLAALAGAWTGRQADVTRVESLPDLTPESIARLIADQVPHAVFWPGDETMETVAEVEALLDAIGCPLILVR